MSFFSVLFALLLEQARPLKRHNPVHDGVRAYVGWVSQNFHAGKSGHDGLAWSLAVGVPALLTWLIYGLLHSYVGWLAAMVWSVATLYITLGFRQFSFHFSQIRDALARGDEDLARELLADWQQSRTNHLTKSDVLQRVSALSILAAHRHVFGVLTWYCLLAMLGLGPMGAVIYRLSEFVARDRPHSSPDSLQDPSRSQQETANRLWRRVDWLPARVTAISFALVGNFEPVADVWRSGQFQDDNDGLIVAAASSALGLQFGPQSAAAPRVSTADATSSQSESAEGSSQPHDALEAPEFSHLALIVGLVWRTVVLWMLLLALLTFSYLLG